MADRGGGGESGGESGGGGGGGEGGGEGDERAAAAEARAWDSYFVVLDAVLNAGPQGEPWSADAIALGANKFLAAGGVAQLVKA